MLFTGFGVHDPFAFGVFGVVVESAAGELFLVLGFTLDIDPPTGESCGQSGVLAFFSDCEGKLIVRNNDRSDAKRLVDHHFFDLCRAQRFSHKGVRVMAERNDVDLLAAKFVYDHADASAPSTDAGTAGVDVLVI